MKNIRPHIARILSILMVLSLLTGAPLITGIGPHGMYSHAETQTLNDFEYTVSGNTVTLTAYTGKDAEPVIPVSIGGKKVTAIGPECFRGNVKIKSIKVPEGITEIGDYAFEACSAATELSLPSTLKKIGKGAFSGDAMLEKIVIPDSVSRIDDGAFLYCMKAESLTGGRGLKELGQFVFAGCEELATVDIGGPELKAIPDRTFCNCRYLSSIKLPDSIGTVGKRAFSRCSRLEKISFGPKLKSVGDYAFANCVDLSELTFDENSAELSLGSNLLYNEYGDGDTHIIMPDNTVISDDTFKEASISGIYVYGQGRLRGDKEYLVRDGQLYGDNGATLIYACHEKYDSASGKWGPVTETFSDGPRTRVRYTVADGVRRIGPEAFTYKTYDNVVLPKSIEETDDKAFRGSVVKSVSFSGANSRYFIEEGILYERVGSASGGKAVEAASGDETVETASGSEAVEAASEGEAVEAASEDEAVETASEEETVEAASEGEAVETASESEAVEATSEGEAAEAASEGVQAKRRLVRFFPKKADGDHLTSTTVKVKTDDDDLYIPEDQFTLPDDVSSVAPYAFYAAAIGLVIKDTAGVEGFEDYSFANSGIGDPRDKEHESSYGGKILISDELLSRLVIADTAFEDVNDYFIKFGEYDDEDEDTSDNNEIADDSQMIREDYPEDIEFNDRFARVDESGDVDGYYEEEDDYDSAPTDPVVTYTSLSGDRSLYSEEKFRNYRLIQNSEFDDWCKEYLEHNKDEIEFSQELMPYTMLYKGEEHYRAMVCVLNHDQYKTEYSIKNVGDDFESMYLMMDHGLEAELMRGEVQEDVVLYSGITVEKMADIAGFSDKSIVPSVEQMAEAIGGYFTDLAFMSTTTDPQIAGSFSSHSETMVVIYASKDSLRQQGAVVLDSFTGWGAGEYEILLNPNAKFRILEVGSLTVGDDKGNTNYDRTYIRLELVGSEDSLEPGGGEDGSPDDEDTDDNSGEADGSRKGKRPDTGDRGMDLYLTMMLGSAAALLAVLAGRIRRKEQK